jgi:putative addiction module CopG family antidote
MIFMSRIYTPGPEADAIVEELLAKGNYLSADEVVRASLQLLQASEPESDEDLQELRRLIAEADADIAAGRVYRYANAEELTADIIARGEARDASEEADPHTTSERWP